MRALLDVNVLIALLDSKNANHVVANDFIAANHADGWASCPLTENACLRLLTNLRHGAPMSPGVVLARPDDVSITNATLFNWDHLRGHQQVTDVYLLALAVAHGGRLVTYDQRIQLAMVRGCRPEQLVTL